MKPYRATFLLRIVTLVGSIALFASVGFFIVPMLISLQVSMGTIFVVGVIVFIAWIILVETDLLAIAIERTLLGALRRAHATPPQLLFTEYRSGSSGDQTTKNGFRLW